MKVTKVMLEKEIESLKKAYNDVRNKLIIASERNEYLQQIIRLHRSLTPLVSATEKTTEALAHVISDLKRR